MDYLIEKLKNKYLYKLIKNQFLINGDCLEVIKNMKDNSVDSIVCDPPYGLSFMGKKWDYDVPKVEIWKECLRVLKHGGHLLTFAGTRTQHRMACNIEDAGFEIRDMIGWIYGSGFPKSLNISKQLDKMAGAKREIIGKFDIGYKNKNRSSLQPKDGWNNNSMKSEFNITKSRTPEAKQWEGWGSALKPAFEPITLARKPLSEKTIASNVLKWGTGGINIDGCRVYYKNEEDKQKACSLRPNFKNHKENRNVFDCMDNKGNEKRGNPKGRFPANIIHDGSEEVMKIFPKSSEGYGKATEGKEDGKGSIFNIGGINPNRYDMRGLSSSRFFYCAKASKKDRNEGLEMFEEKQSGCFEGNNDTKNTNRKIGEKSNKPNEPRRNFHPTVKPTKLMQYLVRLITPPKGIVLDPFMGSGSTGKACVKEQFGFIGIDLNKEYYNIACNRIKEETKQYNFDF